MTKDQQNRISGVSDSEHHLSPPLHYNHSQTYVAVILTAPGFGLTQLPNKKSLARGRPKWTSWKDTPSTDSPAAPRNNTNGSSSSTHLFSSVSRKRSLRESSTPSEGLGWKTTQICLPGRHWFDNSFSARGILSRGLGNVVRRLGCLIRLG